ncbi:MAG: hypothetical protein ACJAZF_002334 [Granulosicoccus sp.]|jgi:hypothetical protein
MTSFVGAKANRNNSIGGLPKVPGKQLEEFHLCWANCKSKQQFES